MASRGHRELKHMVSSSKSTEPVITTLIPTYRRAVLLERSIRSALSQTYPHLRVCVYDNASGDETRETVRQLSSADPRVSYFCHATNIGPLNNFIHAMERVDTSFFSILSDDDILLPRFYETAMEGFKHYPEAMLSATATLKMDTDGRILGATLLDWKPGLYQPPDGFLAMLDKGYPLWTSVVFRQEVLHEAGGLDEETGVPSDLDYLLRIAARLPIVVSTELGGIFVVHGANWSSTPKALPVSGLLKVIQNQTQDERVPVQARAHARKVLTKALIQTIFVMNGLRSIVLKRWRDSHEAAHVLRWDYRLWIRASVLSVVSWACEHLPLAHRAVVTFYSVRRLLKRLRQRPLQRQFGSYAAYLSSVRPRVK
jgi:hypothetical protein